MENIEDFITPQGNPNMLGGMPPQGVAPQGMPPMSPEMGGAEEQPEMVGPDQVAELKGMFQDVQNKNAQLSGKEIINRNQVSLMRKDVLSKLFQVLQDAGVDPANPESVRGFLQSLEEQDPDLFEIFMTAFSDVQNGPDAGMSPEEPGLMDQFQNLSRMGEEPAPEAAPPMPVM